MNKKKGLLLVISAATGLFAAWKGHKLTKQEVEMEIRSAAASCSPEKEERTADSEE